MRKAWPGILAVLAIWALCRPYGGVIGDAILYMGRGLADLDPGGVGRDAMFREDGQSAFSVYPLIVDGVLSHLGIAATGMTLAIVNLIAWIAALALLSRALTEGRLRWAILILVAAAPTSYGAHGIFGFAEPIAAPRGLAEAAVLAGLSVFIRGRNLIALVFVATGALFNPIMAFAAAVIILVVLASTDRRWLIGIGVIALATLAAAWLGLPLASRLFARFDPEWFDLLTGRLPFLFPSLWPLEAYSSITVRMTTLAMAAGFMRGRSRAVFISVIGVGVGGLAAAYVFGDRLNLMLVVQAQLWRSLWLVASLGASGLAICAAELWRRGAAYRLCFGLICLAWVGSTLPGVAFGSSALALAVLWSARAGRSMSPWAQGAMWLITGLLLLHIEGATAIELAGMIQGMPPGTELFRQYVLASYLHLLPVVILLTVYLNNERMRLPPTLAAIGSLCLAALAVTTWDSRAPRRISLESGRPPEELAALIGDVHRDMLWLPAGAEPWFWFHTPNWGADFQGAGMVFSRPLAMFWAQRMHELVALGILDKGTMTPFATPVTQALPVLTKSAILSLCLRVDGPAVIVAGLETADTIPSGIEVTVWRLPVPQYSTFVVDGEVDWNRVEAYVVIKCDAVRQKQAKR